jgi:hypothetical protein
MQYTLVSADDHLALNYTRKRNINSELTQRLFEKSLWPHEKVSM